MGAELELPDAFVEATTEGEVRTAHGLLKEAIGLLRRGDDIEGIRNVEIANARLDRLVKLFDRPRNNPSGRQVCAICGSHAIMPNGRCPLHGGE